MNAPRRSTGRRIDWPIAIVFGLVVLSASAFGLFYYSDRYTHDGDQQPLDRQVQHLEAMIIKYPQNADLRVSAADFYLEIGRVDQAIEQLNEALKVQPDHLDGLILLGRAYAAKNDDRTALARYKRVVTLYADNPLEKIDPRMSVVYYQMAELYNRQGDSAQAIDALRHALNVDRTDADAYFLLGTIYQKHGEHAQAVAEFEQALRFVPEFVNAYSALDASYTALGQSAEASFARAMATLLQGDATRATAQLEALRQQAPDLAQVQFGLGLAYERLRRRDDAKAALIAYLAARPNDIAASQALGRVSQETKP